MEILSHFQLNQRNKIYRNMQMSFLTISIINLVVMFSRYKRNLFTWALIFLNLPSIYLSVHVSVRPFLRPSVLIFHCSFGPPDLFSLQVFVETLDRCFENVCELDLIFHVDKVHYILQEIVMGGMVLETNMNEVIQRIEDQNKLEKVKSAL